jgi:cob(I)alamin adenosyltransferase
MTSSRNRRPKPAEGSPGRVRKGLVVINTGDGKGKSTAAFGIMTRAWGRDMKVTVVQFIKQPKGKYGEQMAAAKMGIEMTATGKGFTWESENLDDDASAARMGWRIAKERILSGKYDVVILDEITYPIRYGWIDVEEVLEALRQRPEMQHVVITGRDAQPELIDFADLVTEMKTIKHPYADQGIKAQRGVEF